MTGKASCYKPSALSFIRLAATISRRRFFFKIITIICHHISNWLRSWEVELLKQHCQNQNLVDTHEPKNLSLLSKDCGHIVLFIALLPHRQICLTVLPFTSALENELACDMQTNTSGCPWVRSHFQYYENI